MTIQTIAATALAVCTLLAPANAGVCGLHATSGWRAAIGKPASGRMGLELVVSGRVTAPAAGWRIRLKQGPMTRSMPPDQIIVLEAKPPSGPAATVLTVGTVRLRMAGVPRYRSVRIVCDGKLVHEFRDLAAKD